MKEGWQRRRFGEVCDLKKGKKPTLQTTRAEGIKPYLVAKYLRGAEPAEFASVSGRNSVSVSAEEIIIICDGSNSGETFIGFDGVLSSTMAKIGHGEEIDNRFLMHFLDSLFEKFNAAKTGAAIPHLDLAALREEVLPLPPVDEQQRIVGILDQAFDSIATAKANAEKNLQNARALFESHLQSVFTEREEGWIETTLEHVLVEQPRNGWSPPAANHSDSGVPVLTLSAVTGFQFRTSKIKFTSAKTDPRRHYWVKNGDFLITRSNTPELVGHVAIATGLSEPTIYPDLIMRMIPSPDLMLTEFLYYQMRTPSLRLEITSRAQGANPTMKKLNKGAVQTLPITAPSIPKQREIVDQLDHLAEETQRLETLYQRKLAALDALKQSLLHQAFSGQL